MDAAVLDALRKRLTDELAELHVQLQDIGVDPKTGQPQTDEFDHGFADSGHATAEKANLLGVASSLLETLREVENALHRMDAGTYGTCESCGDQIPAERLEARPHATLCVKCKQRR